MHLGLLIYGSLDTLSGGYLYDRRLVEYLRSQGDTVDLISLPWRSYPAHLADNLSFRLPGGLDLLIQDELNHPSLLFANARPHPYPVVSLVHHLRSSEARPAWQNALHRLVETRYLRSVDGFIFNSETTRANVQGLAGPDKPHIVAHPPSDRFSPSLSGDDITRRARLGDLRIVFLGNVIPRKGLDTLLDALRLLPFPFHLDVIGSLTADPAYARRMQALAAPLGPGVTFHSSLDDPALGSLLAAAHVLAVPSTYEGFGIVYLEGMAFGLPAIGTTLGAAREIITDRLDGFLIPPADPRSLAARLILLASDRDLLARMSLAARERFLREPPWDVTAARIRTFLQKML
ncbi:MAG: glycosyltransferase family 4 protein [Bacteroidota bacterium]